VRAVCHTSTTRLTTRSLSSQGACAARHNTQSTLKNDLEFIKILIFLQTNIQRIMYERNIYDYRRPKVCAHVQCCVQIGRRKACRLWSSDHVFYREPGRSSLMYCIQYTLYNILRYDAFRHVSQPFIHTWCSYLCREGFIFLPCNN
jgi:hypothetical protein